ncbi:hypothetical protein [Lunatibacter salilacus]|uniref:hypothetical protein n=1 Tax=Lunatibacter salilacus TaxID=2483804 RepID=UPI00131CD287|nr:hypothetical protein [Lunatibacter salilacus]
MPQEIEIYIDRIVLEGLDHLNTRELNHAIQQHLTTLLSEQGLSHGFINMGQVNKLNGGQIYLASNSTTGQVGESIAGGIHQGIKTIELESHSFPSRQALKPAIGLLLLIKCREFAAASRQGHSKLKNLCHPPPSLPSS